VAEHPRAAAVGQQQRREQAHERRLAGAVLAEHGDALAAGDRERHVVERHDRRTFAPDEVLVELDDLYCGHDGSLKEEREQGRLPEAVLGSAAWLSVGPS
jgi:hypothetical protein